MTNRSIPDFLSIEDLPPTFLSKEELLLIIFNTAKNYKGNGDLLKDAIGILIMSQIYGHRVVRLVWNKNLIHKIEIILGKKLSEISYAETDYTDRSLGIKMIKGMEKIGNNLEKVFNDIFYNRTKKPEEYKLINF